MFNFSDPSIIGNLSNFSTQCNRRAFLTTVGNSFGAVALSSLLGGNASAATPSPFFAPKAKRVIYLFQSGGPSHVDLFDGKPSLIKNQGKDLPDEVRGGQRVTGMTAGQKKFAVRPPLVGGKQCGEAGAWISDLLSLYSEGGGQDLRHPLHAHRGHQPRPSSHSHQHWLHAAWSSFSRSVAFLWTG